MKKEEIYPLMFKLLLGIGLLVSLLLYIQYGPKYRQVNPLEYFDEFNKDQINLVIDDRRYPINHEILEKNNEIYLSTQLIRQEIDDRLYYDKVEKILTLTTLQDVIRIPLNSNVGTNLKGEKITLEAPIIEENETAYVPSSLVKKYYPVGIQYGKTKEIVSIDHLDRPIIIGELKRSELLRTFPNNQSVITERVKRKEKVIVYEENNKYLKVKTESGIIGYLKKSSLKKDFEEIYQPLKKETPLNDLRLTEPIQMVWDQMGVEVGKTVWQDDKYKVLEGKINVISPTWFEFMDKDGTLLSKANLGYVKEAHQRGIQVWPILAQSFTKPELTKEILTSTTKRQYVIDQILNYAKDYELDGINVDIENVQEDFQDEWVQFMRELYPQANQLGIRVSVDVYVPSEWSKHYQRSKISEVVDYFMVMAYDQYWSGSEEAGPVSSLVWTEEKIQENLKEVPKEKLVLGIPTYVRHWAETANGLETRSYSMNYTQKRIAEWGAAITKDETTGLNYVEHKTKDKTYKIWIEDRNSIQERMRLIDKYQLAGFSFWKLGLESEDIWQEVKNLK